MTKQPKWWNQEHDSSWDRVKDALKRDWEQTKSDLSMRKAGTDLDQDVGDTVRQAVGKDDDKSADWSRVEPEYRYGVGAARQYGDSGTDWDDRVESKLREEWSDLKSGRTWDEAKGSIRSGWDRARGTKR